MSASHLESFEQLAMTRTEPRIDAGLFLIQLGGDELPLDQPIPDNEPEFPNFPSR